MNNNDEIINECKKFIKEHKISCPESIYQVDQVLVDSLGFIERICELVGYYKDHLEKAAWVLHHDDSPCYDRLDNNGLCCKCGYHPDMQSTCFHPYCPSCDEELKEMQCPNCLKKYRIV